MNAWQPAVRVVLAVFFSLLSVLCLTGCGSHRVNYAAIDSYYRYQFTDARQSLRDALDENGGHENNDTILNNTRLGMASLADGDLREAESALGKSFDLLSTAGLNKDRTVAAVLDHEGVRIWKGEPFEQALTYHYVALTYALQGDWENTRAAAANSLFRLTDFGKDQSAKAAAKRSGTADASAAADYTAVDTNFALGFLMQAIGSDLAGTAGAKEQFDAALRINSDLKPVIDRLRARDYDTLLIVDYGRGPSKHAYGTDGELAEFTPNEAMPGRVIVTADNQVLARANPACDVNAMAQDLRWNNLEGVRKAKSFVGNALLVGGAVATGIGASNNNGAAALAGVGAMALGLLTKAGSKADTRYCEYMPQCVYLVPLTLARPSDVTVQITNRPAATMLMSQVAPGRLRKPTVIYLRLFRDGGGTDLSWLTRRRPVYTNDHTGVARGDGASPWILGGRDVSAPTRETLAAYQASGFLAGYTVGELQRVYQDEGLHIGSGMMDLPNTKPEVRDDSYRHVLEGGTGVFTPQPYSMGYQRIMNSRVRAYKPQSDAARNAADAVRVREQEMSAPAAAPVVSPPTSSTPSASPSKVPLPRMRPVDTITTLPTTRPNKIEPTNQPASVPESQPNDSSQP